MSDSGSFVDDEDEWYYYDDNVSGCDDGAMTDDGEELNDVDEIVEEDATAASFAKASVLVHRRGDVDGGAAS